MYLAVPLAEGTEWANPYCCCLHTNCCSTGQKAQVKRAAVAASALAVGVVAAAAAAAADAAAAAAASGAAAVTAAPAVADSAAFLVPRVRASPAVAAFGSCSCSSLEASVAAGWIADVPVVELAKPRWQICCLVAADSSDGCLAVGFEVALCHLACCRRVRPDHYRPCRPSRLERLLYLLDHH